ncbi:MAG: hypothetical protein AAF993_10050 [Pseudomonadota bacterium]
MTVHRVDAHPDYVCFAVRGPFVLADLVSAWRSYVSELPVGYIKRILWDLREAEWSVAASELDMLNLRNAAQTGDAPQTRRIFAFLLASHTETAIVELYVPDLETICTPGFFNNEPEAVAWLLAERWTR